MKYCCISIKIYLHFQQLLLSIHQPEIEIDNIVSGIAGNFWLSVARNKYKAFGCKW